jgi:hypothetical protein
MPMTEEEQGYISYLLRLWQIKNGTKRVWRASLENPRTGQRRGFATPADCFAFLAKEMRDTVQEEAAPPAVDDYE